MPLKQQRGKILGIIIDHKLSFNNYIKRFVETLVRKLLLSKITAHFTMMEEDSCLIVWLDHNLDLSCVWQSDAASFFENYANLYFDVKHLQKGLNRGL